MRAVQCLSVPLVCGDLTPQQSVARDVFGFRFRVTMLVCHVSLEAIVPAILPHYSGTLGRIGHGTHLVYGSYGIIFTLFNLVDPDNGCDGE